MTEAQILKLGRKRADRLTAKEKQIHQEYWDTRLKRAGFAACEARLPDQVTALPQPQLERVRDGLDAAGLDSIRSERAADREDTVESRSALVTYLTPEAARVLEAFWQATSKHEEIKDVFLSETVLRKV